MKTAITITTINTPKVIKDYIDNIKKYNHNEVDFIIVADKKTPSDAKSYCKQISKKFSVNIKFLDIKFQKKYLKKFKDLNKYIPYNSFARRNIADLLAYEEKYDKIIRIDDDNYPTNDDFIKYHNIVGNKTTLKVISSSNKWFNVCDELIDENNTPFYPRGFLYDKRWKKNNITAIKKKIKIVLNAGLWLGDPDIDAITRLCQPINAIKYKKSFGNYFSLDKKTWCPINTQNTSYVREIIPISFVPPNVGRYDDIWSGYLLKKITDYMGVYISYGKPLLFQRRNVHNLWKDLKLELNGNIYSSHLIDALESIKLTKKTYIDSYYQLAEKLEKEIKSNKDTFKGVINGMKIWADALGKID